MAKIAQVKQVRGRAVYIAGNDIDTDRIIPGRFLRCVTFDSLGEYAFYDVRFNEDGGPTGHPLDAPEHRGAKILVSDNNFGCGSSREHAPQALQRFGIEAIVAGSFAEIFFGNSTTLGLACATMPDAEREQLGTAIEESPEIEWTLDLEASELRGGGRVFKVQIKDSARQALIAGSYDPLMKLLESSNEVKEKAAELGYA